MPEAIFWGGGGEQEMHRGKKKPLVKWTCNLICTWCMRWDISPNRFLRITWRVFWQLMIWSTWSARVTIFRYKFLLCLQLKLILTSIWLWAIKFVLSQNLCAWAIVLYLRPCGERNDVFLHFCQKCKRQMEKNNAVF